MTGHEDSRSGRVRVEVIDGRDHLAGRDVGGIAIRLLDDVYMAWSRAQTECHIALRAWFDSGTTNRETYHAYRAALDREEAAAVDLERISQLVAA